MYRSELLPAVFVGGGVDLAAGAWRVERIQAVRGDPLPVVERVHVHVGAGTPATAAAGAWALRGVAGHARYVERAERVQLDAVSPPLDRPEATRAALIPIRKSPSWWALMQDERRAVFEERSRHIADSLPFLPRIARRLYHSRDLGEPFDFLTWFEYAPEHAGAFEELVALLRSREEWAYVDREVDIRLAR
ncbi:MAG TPA: chlorite dismutase family protein [Myxococcaceae bacterium]|nr:chlorite dismutase family protein [Myxococcaceae bacterium]